MNARTTSRQATQEFALRRGRLPVFRADFFSGDRARDLMDTGLFHSSLTLERRRAERSHKPFALMLIQLNELMGTPSYEKAVEGVVSGLAFATRETDLIGWYENEAVLGVIFTEIDLTGSSSVLSALQVRLTRAIEDQVVDFESIRISLHVFPEESGKDSSGRVADLKLYPDISKRSLSHRVARGVKRAGDIGASAFLLILLSPVFAAIAAAIKLTSKGPIFFRQERLGKFGVPFPCLKFRTMRAQNNPKAHQEFVQNFIKGKDTSADEGKTVFKITDDPRVTAIGRLLRRTSLDELPQLWNVFVGEMSLVGPRPPVRYEYEMYDLWHRRRVLEVQPGITGLWQVTGRSRTRFDEMVRLDLRYSRSWSLWLDLVILLRTPRAVIFGDGAY